MIQVAALIVSFIPAVAIYFWLRNLRENDAEYKQTCRKLLLGGVYCTVLVVLFSLVCSIAWALAGLNDLGILAKEAFRTFVLAALSEELMKYHVANRTIKKKLESVSLLDVIAYTAIVGIGFELAESVVYFFTTNVGQILVRGITFMHTCYGMMMGYYIAKSISTGKKSYRRLAIFLPWFLHGLYDFSLSDELMKINDNFVFLPFITIFITMFIGIKLLLLTRKGKNNEEYTRPLLEETGE